MSQHHGDAHDASGHDADHHEAFDPEPVQELGADETPSPTWLPIVGGCLLLVAVGYVFYPGGDAVAKAPEAKVAASAPVAAAAPPPGSAKRLPAAAKPGSKLLPKGSLKKVEGKK